MRIWWTVKNGRTYQLQTRPRLVGSSWSDAGAPHASGMDGQHYADRAYNTNAYFRVRVKITE